MRNYFFTKWIQELNLEMQKAKAQLNLHKLLEIKAIRDELLDLRDGLKR